MTEARVARRYAKALFQAATKEGIVSSVESDLNLIMAVARGSGAFTSFLGSPDITRERKFQVVEKAFSDRVTALTMAFVRLLLDKRRETTIPLVRENFIELRRESEHVVRAVVTSREPMGEEDKLRILKRLEEKSGKRVEAEFGIDPDLIGGLTVRWGDYVLDGSLRGSLSRLEDSLLFDALKQT
ncbi:MAG: ATP synthase F1 subunit delta [Fimbriimonadaceae bacterium]|nr:ATP synthase F1 subunit delta [Fimbriimonadaceae bacterium]